MTIFSKNKAVNYAEIDELAAHARGDGGKFDKLFKKFLPYLRKTASDTSSANPNGSYDDMYEVVSVAFYQAVKVYSLEKGPFIPLMQNVVKRRVIDSIRKNYTKKVETVPLDGVGDDPSAASSAANSASLKAYQESERQKELKYEISAFMDEIKAWGFNMKQLVDHSPKQGRLRKSYDIIFNKIINDKEIMGIILTKRYYPVKNIAQLTEMSPKTVSRSRIFIIAQIILLRGDYDSIRTYVNI